MKPIRAKAKPHGVFPKRLLLSTLRQLGQEVGFSLPTLKTPGSGHALTVRVTVYRRGVVAHHVDVSPDPRQPWVQVWQNSWENALPEGETGEDLISIEYLHEPTDSLWLAPIMAQDVAGQFLARGRASRSYSSVLASMVPYRGPGYRFTPIIGLTHYYKIDPEFENYTLFVNLRGGELSKDEGNRLHMCFYSFAGEMLGATELAVPHNSALLHPLEPTLRGLGVPADALSGGVTAHCRGGSSQFAVFTLIRNTRTGALGIEHSLPPYYYVTGISHPSIRGRFYERALAGT